MTDFTFTVRAQDNLGAYADRTFNIRVRNTVADMFVAINGTDAMSSVDGSTWTLRPGSGGITVTHGGGLWIVGTGTATYRTSPDAINWNDRTLASNHSNFCYGNGMWMVTATNGTTSTSTDILTSYDGITWTVAATIPNTTATPRGQILFGGGKWLIRDHVNGTGKAGIWSADNGQTWTVSNLPAATLALTSYRGGPNAMGQSFYANGLWLIPDISNANDRLFTSTDLVVWTRRSLSISPTSQRPHAICYGNGRLVVTPGCTFQSMVNSAAMLNSMQTSENGSTWTQRTAGPTITATQYTAPSSAAEVLSSCTYGMGKFLATFDTAAVGQAASNQTGPASNNSGNIWQSTDGLSWSQITGLPFSNILDIATMSLT